MQIPTRLLPIDPTIAALDRGENTKGWDAGADASEPDDSEERAELAAALAELEEDNGW